MGSTVYADLYFLINFSMDFLCFFLAGKLISKKTSLLRMCLGSAVGGIYAILILIISTPAPLSLLFHLSVCALMCLIALCDDGSFRELPFYMLIYTALSMALGGSMTALFNLFDKLIPSDLPEGESMPTSDSISVYTVAILAATGAVITLLGGNMIKKRMSRRRAVMTVEFGGKKATLLCLCDTGNLLREPISGRPCAVATPESLSALLPPYILSGLKDGIPADRMILKCKDESARSLRMIPAHTASGSSILLGFIPDAVYVDLGRGKKRVEAAIAIGQVTDSGDSICALLPSELTA